MESNREQTLADYEKAFEDSKQARFKAKHQWEAAKAKYHMQLVARRESGETLTVSDIKALEAIAIDEIDFVKGAYLDFIKSDSGYRAAKVAYEAAKRDYWDSRNLRH